MGDLPARGLDLAPVSFVRLANLFPSNDEATSYSRTRGIPREVGASPEGPESPDAHVMIGFTHLPELFTRLERLDFFLRVEKNALLFETHLGLESPPASAAPYLDSPIGTVKDLLLRCFRSFP